MTKKRISKKEREQQEALAAERQRRRRVAFGVLAVVTVALVLLEVLGSSLGALWPLGGKGGVSQSITNPDAPLASFYTPEVLRWESDILRWAREYRVNPNVIAVVVQIESCGSPSVMSVAGAVGLMQVMPFHFANGDNMLNPDTNVQRGMSVFYECLTQFASWDLGMALACYNGGPAVTQSDYDTWAAETQYYYRWATGLWNDVVHGRETSKTLAEWLAAGGERLCDDAALALLPDVAATASSAGSPPP